MSSVRERPPQLREELVGQTTSTNQKGLCEEKMEDIVIKSIS